MTKEQIAREILFVDSVMQSHFNDYGEETHRALQEAFNLILDQPTKEEQAILKKWRDNRGISMKEFEDALNVLQNGKSEDNKDDKKLLIIKAKHNIPKEVMKNTYRNFLEQIQIGLLFVDDNYEINIVELDESEVEG